MGHAYRWEALMQVVSIPLRTLKASGQPRKLVTEHVDGLAASIKEVGLIQPITVRRASVMDGVLAGEGHQIIAGHHRVAAARALGWESIDAVVVDVEQHLQAELIEIDENLQRAELTAAQRSKAIKRRKEIWEALHPIQVEKVFPPESEVGYKKPPPQSKSFAADTAKSSGMTKQAINQHVARAEALGDDINRIVGTSLDKGVELDALKDMPAQERDDLITRAQAGEKVSARGPQKKTVEDPARGSVRESLKRIRDLSDDDLTEFLCSVEKYGFKAAVEAIEAIEAHA